MNFPLTSESKADLTPNRVAWRISAIVIGAGLVVIEILFAKSPYENSA